MGVSYNPKIVTDGLVLCLDAANPKSYPGTGTTLVDLSNNSNNGTIINNPTISNGIIDLSGTNEYVNTNLTTNYSALSLCCWVKNTTNSSGGVITKGEVNSTEYGISFGYFNPLLLVCRANTGIGYIGQITVPWQNTSYATGWHYICLTIGNNLKTLFIDGVQITQNSGNIDSVAEPFHIGFHGSYYYFNGQLNLPKIYNKALSPSEIQQNFNATRGRYGI